ncbi:MAG TPA: APC family permease [Candidatus Limnocylindrales bacterium]|nr:APC family permease [Candidatus Limnocylindrales bacterium]
MNDRPNSNSMNSRQAAGEAPSQSLERGLGLLPATALNMIDMVGIGPFIVAPLVIQSMGGSQSLLAWVVGAGLAMVDGCVWAELGAAMPQAGGSYIFLREAYGPGRWGRLFSFLFIWQTLIQAPLVIASGAIGFSQYLTYLVPLSTVERKLVSGGLVVLLVMLLYRRITTIGRISVLLWIGVMGTMVWVIFGGATHFNAHLAFSYPAGAFSWSWLFFAGLGHGTIKTIYSYLGYYNICHLGGEIRNPEKNIPRGIFLSIFGIAALYLLMQTSLLGVLPWHEAAKSDFIVSAFMERIYGARAAQGVTVMILWVAFASLFSALLGYSRVPYAAACDGNFFPIFARLHPEKNFPYVSLLFLGAVALVFSMLFRLETVITGILAMRVLIQFISQGVGVMILRRRWPSSRLPYKMWLYPLPALLSIVGWAALFVATGRNFVLGGLSVILAGTIVYLVQARVRREWPFQAATNPQVTA